MRRITETRTWIERRTPLTHVIYRVSDEGVAVSLDAYFDKHLRLRPQPNGALYSEWHFDSSTQEYVERFPVPNSRSEMEIPE
jgi:hypothetical protein